MQYLPNTKIPCLEYGELIPHIMPKGTYDSIKHRGGLKASCVGGNGRVILIEFYSLPKKYQDAVIRKYGDPKEYIAMQPLKGLAMVDTKARQFYAEQYLLPTGEPLPLPIQIKYAYQCDWLGAIHKAMTDKRNTKDEGVSKGHLLFLFTEVWILKYRYIICCN